MEESVLLPRISTLSFPLLLFLEDEFKKREDLHKLPSSLLTHTGRECLLIEQNLLRKRNSLSLALSDWISRSQKIRMEIRHLCPSSSSCPDKLDGNVRSMLSVELPLLVKEVARIDTVRLYAETTLKLEALVGDLEDATLSIVSCTSRNNITTVHSKSLNTTDSGQKQEKLILAIKALEGIEEVLFDVTKRRPQWTRFLMAVDSRVEKAFAILRPKALSDHRVLLSSLGWPPSLSASNIEKGKCMEMLNPLVQMQGKNKENYFSSFLALCALQHLQIQRRARQHELLRYQKGYKLSDSMDIGKQSCLEHGLWVMDELVYPIASRMECHFKHWSDEPKFTFALVYKMTRDFLDGMDNVLQPLIDKAMIVGCSAKEAWVSAMVKFLTRYLERQVFPALARNYDGTDKNLDVSSSWLQHIDLMITFDKRMKALATSGMPIMEPFSFEGLSRATSLLSVFVEHPDWLQIWATIELKDAEEKLQVELDDERNWLIDIWQRNELPKMEETESFILSSRKDYKAPLIADSVVRISWALIQRAQSLPTRLLRNQFMRSSVTLFLNHFFVILLQRCQDLDSTSAVLEDDALLRVVGSVNVGRYCESLLQQWTDDISFLEMSVADDNQHSDSSFFEDEIMFLVKLESDSLVDVMSAILLQFDALCWEYIEDLAQLGEEQIESKDMILEERNISVSPGIIYALEMLRDRIDTLRLNLNSQDFVDLWRSIAGGLDHFIFTSVSASNAKISLSGVEQLKFDMVALFLIFSPFCARPEAFFPCISDYLKLLALGFKDVNYLLKSLFESATSEECLRSRGLFNVSVGQAVNILRNRRF